MTDFDKLNMEMLMNKKQYQKYLSKTDPDKHKVHLEFLKSVKKHKYEILKLTNQFLDNPNTDFNLSVNEMFETYAKSLIEFIEIKKLDQQTNGGCYENDYQDDENEAFDKEQDDDENEDETYFGQDHYLPNRSIDSFWGKNITKKN
tara:strand:+ start:5785 stop:6222 length:438 start_codon:yes stop_codon:yes gene_type:complete